MVYKHKLHLFITSSLVAQETGKSHLIKAIYQMVIRTIRREEDDPTTLNVLLTVPTGTAAHDIDGLTIHSALQLQLGQGAKNSLEMRSVTLSGANIHNSA